MPGYDKEYNIAIDSHTIAVCFYDDDLQRVDRMVEQLKERGVFRPSRSRLVRYALSVLDLEKAEKALRKKTRRV